MTDPIPTLPTPTRAEQQAAWDLLEQRLACLDWVPPVTPAEIDQWLAQMPARRPGEDLTDWLRRSFRPVADRPATEVRATAQVIPFRRPPTRPVHFIGELRAYAAAEPGQDPPPLPEVLEIGPGDFAVGFAVEGGLIRVRLMALGFTLARLVGREVAVTGPAGLAELLAVVEMDARGEGTFTLPNGPEARRLLWQLRVAEIEPV